MINVKIDTVIKDKNPIGTEKHKEFITRSGLFRFIYVLECTKNKYYWVLENIIKL